MGLFFRFFLCFAGFSVFFRGCFGTVLLEWLVVWFPGVFRVPSGVWRVFHVLRMDSYGSEERFFGLALLGALAHSGSRASVFLPDQHLWRWADGVFQRLIGVDDHRVEQLYLCRLGRD